MKQIIVKIKNGVQHVFLKSGTPTCECCCIFDINQINIPTSEECLRSMGRTCGRQGAPPYGFLGVWPTLPCIGEGITSGLLGEDAYTSPLRGRYFRSRACLAFYYRIINYEKSANGSVLSEGEITSGARDLKSGIELWLPYREDKINLFENESCGLYIYKFEFLHWRAKCAGNDAIAEWGGPQKPDCIPEFQYGVDMFYVTQLGPFFSWPPAWE